MLFSTHLARTRLAAPAAGTVARNLNFNNNFAVKAENKCKRLLLMKTNKFMASKFSGNENSNLEIQHFLSKNKMAAEISERCMTLGRKVTIL